MVIVNKYIYKCVNCGETYDRNDIFYVCPKCYDPDIKGSPPKGILKVKYDYSAIKNKASGISLFKNIISNSLLDLLPIQSIENQSFLKVGNTPLYQMNVLENEKLPFQLYLKDDSQNPTYSFKDRASNLVSAWAKEHTIDTIITASTGNAGSSLAGICASQNQKAIIFIPASAPKAKLTQIVMYGAMIIPVDGTYDQAFDLSIKVTNKFGLYNRNTAFNPFTIEGKKTVSLELYEQLNFQVPDRIFVPVGDGVIISGVYKGFEDMLELGIIEKIPEIVAVQAEGSNNIISNLDSDNFVSKPSNTIADSISVDIPGNFYMARDFITNYSGKSVSVTDEEILTASKILSSNYGLFMEPAASAAFAGFYKYFQCNKINDNSKNIVLLTGNGLKDLNAVQSKIVIPEAIEPNIEKLKDLIKTFRKF